jgi:hypothetical protein
VLLIIFFSGIFGAGAGGIGLGHQFCQGRGIGGIFSDMPMLKSSAAKIEMLTGISIGW